MEKQELIRYRTYADALIRLNNAASTLLHEGANPEAIKLILTGTAQLYSELEERMSRTLPEAEKRSIDLNFKESRPQDMPIDEPADSDESAQASSNDSADSEDTTRRSKRKKAGPRDKSFRPPHEGAGDAGEVLEPA